MSAYKNKHLWENHLNLIYPLETMKFNVNVPISNGILKNEILITIGEKIEEQDIANINQLEWFNFLYATPQDNFINLLEGVFDLNKFMVQNKQRLSFEVYGDYLYRHKRVFHYLKNNSRKLLGYSHLNSIYILSKNNNRYCELYIMAYAVEFIKDKVLKAYALENYQNSLSKVD